MLTPTWEETSPLASDADTPGLIEPGNIDLTNRPIVRHPDGSYSTVKSASFNFDGQEVLLPTVSDTGEMLSNDDAISLYKKTGKHLGKFSTPEAATDYAKQLHESQAKLYDDRANAPSWDETEPVNPQISTQPWQQPGADLGPFGGYAPFAPGRLAHMEEAQDILRAPGAALGAALEPVQETVSRVTSDFLNRTGLDPSAMPGRNIVQLPHVSRTGVPSAVINRLSDIGSGFTEPGQAATLPFLAFKPVQAAFAAQSLAALPESARELAQAGTLPEAAAALTSGGVNALIARQLGKSLTEGAPNAVETREIPQGDLIEHPRTEEVGVRPQTGSGDSPAPVPTWEETVAVEPEKETVTPTVTETTPPVPKEEMPQTPTATGLRPAIRLVGGKVIPGDAGVTHADIIKANDIKAEDIDQRGFVNEKGEFQDREQAADQTQLPTHKEEDRLHSTDLPEAQKPVGAATPQDIPEGTGLKNAIGEVERAQRGLPEATETQKQAMATTWALAGEELKANPRAGELIVADLKADPSRGLTDVDSAVLLRHKVAVENAANDAAERTITAKTDAERALAQDDYARLSDQLLEILNMTKERGSQWGREGRWRQAIAQEDFSLATMETRMRQSVGGRRLTEEEHKRVVELNETLKKRIAELEAAQKQAESTGRDKAASDAHKEVSDSAPKAKTPKPPAEELVDLKGKLTAKLDKNEKAQITPLVKKLAEQLWLSGIKELNPMIDALHGILGDLIPGITRLETMDALSGRGQFTLPNPEAVKVAIRDLSAQSRIAGHIEDTLARKPLPRTGPQRDAPTDAQRKLLEQLKELQRRIGVVVTDPAAQLKTALQAAKTYTRNRIADLRAEIAARERNVKTKTPLQPDAELEAMRAELESVKAEHEQVFGKRELTDEQRVAIADKMLDRQIAKLESDLDAGKIAPEKKISKTPETPELLAKRSWLKALQEYRQDLRDAANPKLTPEERALKMIKTRLAKRTAEYYQKLADGDFTVKKRVPTPLDNEALRAKANLERAKQEWREGLNRARIEGRSWLEKIRDFAGRWTRELVLSGPASILKLTNAAIQGMILDPVKESVGAGVSKVFPKFAERTELERPSSVAIEAKAWSQAFRRILDDAGKTLKTGQSDLDRAFGGRDAVPPEMRAYMGRLHSALKTPLKRQAWTRASEVLARDYLAKGIDIHDPLIQMEIGNKAFRQAERALFMEDNMVVDAYKRLLSRFDQVKQGEHITAGQALAGTALRVGLPVVKIPTNLVARTFQAGFGGFTGSARLAYAYAKGIENLPKEKGDAIMRQLKAGSIGSALMLMGFLAPELFGGFQEPGKKRKPGELGPGEARIGSVTIPKFLLERPETQIPHFGATVRHVMEQRIGKDSLENKGLVSGLGAATAGLLEETPFINEMINMSRAQQAPGKWLGAEAASRVVPAALSQTARFTDRDAFGNPIKRKAGTFTEQLKAGVPILREEVPAAP